MMKWCRHFKELFRMNHSQTQFWSVPSSDLLQQLQTTPQGLMSDEVQQRLLRYGSNLLKHCYDLARWEYARDIRGSVSRDNCRRSGYVLCGRILEMSWKAKRFDSSKQVQSEGSSIFGFKIGGWETVGQQPRQDIGHGIIRPLSNWRISWGDFVCKHKGGF